MNVTVVNLDNYLNDVEQWAGLSNARAFRVAYRGGGGDETHIQSKDKIVQLTES